MPTHQQLFNSIFERGSTTYYTSSLFFPKKIKEQVFTLYAFVRVADDFVDAQPAQKDDFYEFCELFWLTLFKQKHHLEKAEQLLLEKYLRRWSGRNKLDLIKSALLNDQSNLSINQADEQLFKSVVKTLLSEVWPEVINSFVELILEKKIKIDWVEAFLCAMELDLFKQKYYTIEETITYMYGSAEVIGLMLAQIFELPNNSWSSARMLGRAMQFINMIRDVAEDEKLGRTYLPVAELHAFHLQSISSKEAGLNPYGFSAYLQSQIGRYARWMLEAKEGFWYLPFSLLLPVSLASEMYDWTAEVLAQRPNLVWLKKLKPSKIKVIFRGFRIWLELIFKF